MAFSSPKGSMNLLTYNTFSNAEHTSYEFLSIGPRGTIKKIVHYVEISRGVYNLGFGDWDEVEQKVKDDVRTNNGDREKVLATIASTVFKFTKIYPEAIIFLQGQTLAKTRLYQIGIKANRAKISEIFEIIGFTNGSWEPVKENKNYQAFILRPK